MLAFRLSGYANSCVRAVALDVGRPEMTVILQLRGHSVY